MVEKQKPLKIKNKLKIKPHGKVLIKKSSTVAKIQVTGGGTVATSAFDKKKVSAGGLLSERAKSISVEPQRKKS